MMIGRRVADRVIRAHTDAEAARAAEAAAEEQKRQEAWAATMLVRRQQAVEMAQTITGETNVAPLVSRDGELVIDADGWRLRPVWGTPAGSAGNLLARFDLVRLCWRCGRVRTDPVVSMEDLGGVLRVPPACDGACPVPAGRVRRKVAAGMVEAAARRAAGYAARVGLPAPTIGQVWVCAGPWRSRVGRRRGTVAPEPWC